MRVAYFITPHGFGHASRASAVMEKLHHRMPELQFEIFTTVPEWFFPDSLSRPFGYHAVQTDIGLIQKSSTVEDLDRTVKSLDLFYPTERKLLDRLTRDIMSRGCSLVLCDIAPTGIEAAAAVGIPSILLENFTWDFIYEGYLDLCPDLAPHIEYMRETFSRADFHIQTSPGSFPCPSDLVTDPVSRTPRSGRDEIREKLGVGDSRKVILITMGGIRETFPTLDRLKCYSHYTFVIPGAADCEKREENLILLPHHNQFFHPDLLHAADAVIGKLGYSTLAETYSAGIPYGYIPRPGFRESPVLEAFILDRMRGISFAGTFPEAAPGEDLIADLLSLPRYPRPSTSGADQAAAFIVEILRANRI